MVRLRVAKLLKERGLNAHQLAKGAGLPITTAYRLAKGGEAIKQLNVRTIDKLCTYLGVQPGDLFEYQPRR
jgi:putative transcriptional regulator